MFSLDRFDRSSDRSEWRSHFGICAAGRPLATSLKLQKPPSGLRVEGLRHRYGKTFVLEGIDLRIEPGEVHCLVGPSGCGKTTTLRLIAGLERLREGRIVLNERLLAARDHQVPPEQRRVGLMFQDFALFPHLTVQANIAFGIRRLPRKTRKRRVAMLLERVNMARHAEKYPHMLSGGEQQRVGLARALAPVPELMLLDEAFSALDMSLRAQIREETFAILRASGTPTLLVTHDPDEAVRAGDRIHAIQEGRLVQSGSPQQLHAQPVNAFVASFFDTVRRYRARVAQGWAATPLGPVPVTDIEDGSLVEVAVRVSAVRLLDPHMADGIMAKVIKVQPLGPVSLIKLGLADGSTFDVHQRVRASEIPHDEVAIGLDLDEVFVYPQS